MVIASQASWPGELNELVEAPTEMGPDDAGQRRQVELERQQVIPPSRGTGPKPIHRADEQLMGHLPDPKSLHLPESSLGEVGHQLSTVV